MYTEWGQYGVLATKNSRRQELDATSQLCSVDITTLQCGHWYIAMWTWQHYNVQLQCVVGVRTIHVHWTLLHCNVDISTLQCGHRYNIL